MSATWKRAYLVRRNPRLTAAEFPGRWRQHSDLGGTFPEVRARNRKLVYCLVDHVAGQRIGADRTFDGVGLLWLRSPEMLDAPISDPTAIPTMRADELKVFHQQAFASSVMLEEHVLAEAGAPSVALLTFVRRAAGSTRADFAAAWMRAGLAYSAAAPAAIRRQVRSTAVLEPTIDFDGLAEMWFETIEDAVAAGSDRGLRDALTGPGLVDEGATMRLLTVICHEREF